MHSCCTKSRERGEGGDGRRKIRRWTRKKKKREMKGGEKEKESSNHASKHSSTAKQSQTLVPKRGRKERNQQLSGVVVVVVVEKLGKRWWEQLCSRGRGVRRVQQSEQVIERERERGRRKSTERKRRSLLRHHVQQPRMPSQKKVLSHVNQSLFFPSPLFHQHTVLSCEAGTEGAHPQP